MTIPRQFLLFRDLFLWTKINWKHYWRSIQVPSDHRGRLSKQQQYLTRGKLKMYTFCCRGNYSQLYRAEGWQGRIVHPVPSCDIRACGLRMMRRRWLDTSGERERGEETHGHSVICIGVRMNAGPGVWGPEWLHASLVKIVRTQTEKGRSLVSLS